LGFIKGRVFID